MKKTINYEEKVTISMVEDISNILACAGLIHDLGNPPFGHFGEVAIREWFKNKLCKNEDGSYNFKYDKYDFNELYHEYSKRFPLTPDERKLMFII